MPPRILATTIASLLLALPAFAVTETWDGNSPGGGAGDSNITTALNWADDSPPVSDLLATDLLFGGTTKLAPNFNTFFSTDSISFINTAGAFVLGGATITIGTGGIANTDAQTQTINNNVTLGTAFSSFQAINGSLLFNGTVALGTSLLTVGSAQATTFTGAITGTGTINKSGTGTLTLSNTTISADVNITAGAVNVASAGTTTFNSNSIIDINAGTFDAAGNVTLDNAQLIRDNGATLSIAATKTLTVQNGADATITGTFANSTASTITVTGSGSTFTTTGSLTLNGGSTTNVLAGGSIFTGIGQVSIGTSASGTVAVEGSGSSLGGGNLVVGFGGGTGNLTFGNGSTGTFSAINVDNTATAGTSGTLEIETGATVTGTSLFVGTGLAANTGTLTIDGAGSMLTISGPGQTNIGAAAASGATLNVQNGGVFNSGTGTTTVNATGDVAVAGGTFNSNGNLTLDGGGLTRDAGGVFTLASGRTFTVQGGGDVSFTGDHSFENALTFNVSGAGSTFLMVGVISDLAFLGGLTGNVTSGGSVNVGGAFTISSSSPGTLTVDGSGSMLTVAGFTQLGLGSGEMGTLNLNNNATAVLGVAVIASGAAQGTLNVLSGADATAGNIQLAAGASTGTGNMLVSGGGSSLTQTGAAPLTIGNPNAVQAKLRVEAGGTFNSGTGVTTVSGPGVIEIDGGTYNANGDILMGSNSQLIRSATGSFILAPGRTLTIQSGADAIFAGPFGPAGANVTLSGVGSTLQSTTSDVSIGAGSAFSVQNGATLSAAARVSVGTASAGTMTVSGAGSSVSAGDALGSRQLLGFRRKLDGDFFERRDRQLRRAGGRALWHHDHARADSLRRGRDEQRHPHPRQLRQRGDQRHDHREWPRLDLDADRRQHRRHRRGVLEHGDLESAKWRHLYEWHGELHHQPNRRGEHRRRHAHAEWPADEKRHAQLQRGCAQPQREHLHWHRRTVRHLTHARQHAAPQHDRGDGNRFLPHAHAQWRHAYHRRTSE